MADKPFISTRKYIKWGDAEAGENTDTLVLTSRAKHFVDIRIYLPTTSSSTTTRLPPSRLEWGFAGTSTSTPARHSPDGQLPPPAHSEWTHWIDNKTTEEVRDEGDMYPQANGDVLEKGQMVNPATGRVEAYEEVWVDLEAGRVAGEDGCRSWVLRAEGEVGGMSVRGMVIRIGEWVQAVVRRGEEVSVARWKWVDDGHAWREVAVVGEVEIPNEAFGEGEMREDDKLVGGDGLEWTCVESFSWS